MKRSHLTFVAAAVLVLAAGLAQLVPSHAQTPSLKGVWDLVEMTGPNGPAVKPHGTVIFTEGHFTFVLVIGGNRDPLSGLPGPASDEALTEAQKIAFVEHVRPFGAQSGTYSVSGNTLTLHPTAGVVQGSDGYPEHSHELMFEGENKLTTTALAGGATFTYRRLE